MDNGFGVTVEKIYAAAADSSLWPDALRSIENLTGSTGAVIDLVPRADHAEPRTIAGSFGPEECATYARDYMPICPRIRYALGHPEGTQFDYLFMTEAQMDRDPVYEWLGSYGLRYFIGSWVGRTPSYFATFSLQRSRRQGHAEADHLALYERLKPHALRAIALADQLATLHSRVRVGSKVLEALPQAVFALDATSHLVYANTSATKLLGKADGLILADGRLHALRSAEQTQLDCMVQEAGSGKALSGTGWAKVSRASGGTPYALFVAPLPGSDEILLAAGAAVLVIVHDPLARTSPDPEALKVLYDLTAMEARLATALAAGHSLETAAAALQMGIGTARSHLKHVFLKMQVNRQQDLVRLLSSLSSIQI